MEMEMLKNTHRNLIAIFDHRKLSPLLYFIDIELCDGNLAELVLDCNLLSSYILYEPHSIILGRYLETSEPWEIIHNIINGLAIIRFLDDIHGRLSLNNSRP